MNYLLLIVLLAGQAAIGLELYTWRPTPGATRLVLAVHSGETPQHAVRRYLHGLSTHRELHEMIIKTPMPHLPLGELTKLAHRDFGNRVLIIANSPNHFEPDHEKISALTKAFQNKGVTSYILPFAADLGIENESQELIDLLDTYFSSMIAIGGADIDRRVWGEANVMSYNMVLRRDTFEAALLHKKYTTITLKAKSWLPSHLKARTRIDRMVGICRGMQMVGKIIGLHVGHDIKSELSQSLEHGEGQGNSGKSYDPRMNREPVHPITIFPTQNSTLLNLVGQLVVEVDTYHHQYVFKKGAEHPEVEVAAKTAQDGVVEAFEVGDSVLGVQFHPELMAVRSRGKLQATGLRIINGIADFLTPLKGDSCRAILTE